MQPPFHPCDTVCATQQVKSFELAHDPAATALPTPLPTNQPTYLPASSSDLLHTRGGIWGTTNQLISQHHHPTFLTPAAHRSYSAGRLRPSRGGVRKGRSIAYFNAEKVQEWTSRSAARASRHGADYYAYARYRHRGTKVATNNQSSDPYTRSAEHSGPAGSLLSILFFEGSGSAEFIHLRNG